jgi:putative intracellular protease/amidase
VNENVGTILATAVADPKTIVGAICHGQASLLAAGDSTRCGIQGSLTDCVLEYGKAWGDLRRMPHGFLKTGCVPQARFSKPGYPLAPTS